MAVARSIQMSSDDGDACKVMKTHLACCCAERYTSASCNSCGVSGSANALSALSGTL
jgi:hypothetical protein